MSCAKDIALFYKDVPQESLLIASLMHDVGKKFSYEKALEYAYSMQQDGELLLSFQDFPPIVHAPLGALILKNELNITNLSLLQAVAFHTTGKKDLDTLGLIVYCADFLASFAPIEPEFTKKTLELVKQDLFKGSLTICKKILLHLLHKNEAIHPFSFGFYNWLLKKNTPL